MEIWKDIEGYEGLYQVSNEGRIKRFERKATQKSRSGNDYVITIPMKITKGVLNSGGYCIVSLTKDKINTIYLVHRLVAEAFIPNPEGKPFVDHISTIKTDNYVHINPDGTVDLEKSNLRWCTAKENMNNELTRNKIRENPCRYSSQFNRC